MLDPDPERVNYALSNPCGRAARARREWASANPLMRTISQPWGGRWQTLPTAPLLRALETFR